MVVNSTVQITLDWSDRDLELEESEEQVQRLIVTLDDLEDVKVALLIGVGNYEKRL